MHEYHITGQRIYVPERSEMIRAMFVFVSWIASYWIRTMHSTFSESDGNAKVIAVVLAVYGEF